METGICAILLIVVVHNKDGTTMKRIKILVLAVASGSVVTGCSSFKPKVDVGELPAPSAGIETEYVIDDSNPGFYTDGEWKQSSVSKGYIGEG